MLVAPASIGYAPELAQRLPYDPKAAKALLAEAGYADGFSVTLDCPNDSRSVKDEAICRAIAPQLASRSVSRSPSIPSRRTITGPS